MVCHAVDGEVGEDLADDRDQVVRSPAHRLIRVISGSTTGSAWTVAPYRLPR